MRVSEKAEGGRINGATRIDSLLYAQPNWKENTPTDSDADFPGIAVVRGLENVDIAFSFIA